MQNISCNNIINSIGNKNFKHLQFAGHVLFLSHCLLLTTINLDHAFGDKIQNVFPDRIKNLLMKNDKRLYAYFLASLIAPLGALYPGFFSNNIPWKKRLLYSCITSNMSMFCFRNEHKINIIEKITRHYAYNMHDANKNIIKKLFMPFLMPLFFAALGGSLLYGKH